MSTQLQVPDALTARYEALVRRTGQPREQMMLAALETYLVEFAEDEAHLEEASARGELVDVEVVHAEGEALIAQVDGVGAEERARIRAEVRAQMAAAYGVPLCE